MHDTDAGEVAGRPAKHRRRFRHVYRAEDRRSIRQSLFYENDRHWKFRFGFLFALSVTIACMGLLADSPAIVIGAMLIAPLMNPVLGIAWAISHGRGRRLGRASLTVALATVGGIALAWLWGRLLFDGGQTPEILGRTSPDARDLIVALAAGAAGMYATLRDDGSAALPGVAVAVALVPPLATIGLTLEQGRPDLARGAALLYVTNLVAIVVVAIVVMLVAGFVSRRVLMDARDHLFTGGTLMVLLLVLIAVPLTTASYAAARDARLLADLQGAIQQWLDANGAGEVEITDIRVGDEQVIVDLVGPTSPPDQSLLVESLATRFDDPVEVVVRFSQRTTPRPADEPDQDELEQAELERDVAEVVDGWIRGGEGSYEVLAVELDDGQLIVGVAGTDSPPSADALQQELADELDLALDVRVDWTASQVSGAEPPPATLAEQVEALAADWAEDEGLEVFAVVQTADDVVTVDLIGDEVPTGLDSLDLLIDDELGAEVEVAFRFVPRLPLEIEAG